MGELTTIPVYKNTRDRLKSFGFKGETYDQILKKLMEKTEYITFMERQYEILSNKAEFVPLDEIVWVIELWFHQLRESNLIKFAKNKNKKL